MKIEYMTAHRLYIYSEKKSMVRYGLPIELKSSFIAGHEVVSILKIEYMTVSVTAIENKNRSMAGHVLPT